MNYCLIVEKVNEMFKQKADYYEEIIKAFQSYRSGAYGSEIKLLKWLGDFCLFTIFGSYDLWVLQCDYQKAINLYQQNLYARQTALICFELLSDIPQKINENYQQLLVEKISDIKINERAVHIRKKLNKIRNEKEHDLKDIRDIVAAHREQDVSKHIQIINKMDNKDIIHFAFDYLKLIEELNTLFNDAIIYLSKDQENLGNDKFIHKYA